MNASPSVQNRSQELAQLAEHYLAPNYGKRSLSFVEGKGAWLYTPEGDRYLDLLGGIAVCCLGHAHPRVTEAIQKQAEKLLHVSNLFVIEPQVELARKLVENTFAEKVFFCNSGAEANEAALKLAKKVATDRGETQRYEVVSLQESFHGRTIATLSATGQPKLHEGFKPLLPGFAYVAAHDVEAVTDLVGDTTCAVIVEPIQGESGVKPLSEEYLRLLRDLCTERNALLIIDEIQAGMGRTGKFFSHEHAGIEPDIVTLAKGLGNGFPIGAVLAKNDIMEHLTPGSHGSTFGGNPLACSAALATLETVLEENLMEHVANLSEYLFSELKEVKKAYPKRVLEIRGRGFMVGIEIEGADVVHRELLDRKIIVNCVKGRVIRALPPYVIGKSEVDVFVEALRGSLEESAS